MEPSLKEVQYGFNNVLNNPHEIYRNTLVCPSKIMSEAEFGDLTFTFKAKQSESGEVLDLNFTKADFVEVEGAYAKNMFKIAANEAI